MSPSPHEQDTEIDAAVRAILAARPSFAVGDRVRVLSRPECRYCRESPDEDGLVGVVARFGAPLLAADGATTHTIWVDFGEVVPSHGCSTSHFAPTELELVQP